MPSAYGHPTGQRVVDIFGSTGQPIVWSPPMQWFEAPDPPDRTLDPAWLVSRGLATRELLAASYLARRGEAPHASG